MKQLKLLLFTLLPVLTFAQTGNIKGSISFEKEAAIGGYVKLENTNFQTVVSNDGSFKLKNIPYGEYRLLASFVGAQEYTQVILLNKPQLNINIDLQASIDELSTVTVVGKSEAQLKKEESIKIESIQIGKVVGQVKDISHAIDRMTGVRVQSSGSMGDRAQISLNGLTGYAVRTYKDGMPFEFLYPSLSLTNIPLVNLKRIDVYKGVVPVEVGSDAMAGAVNLVSDYKDFNFFNTSYSIGSFNTHQFSATNNYVSNNGLIFNTTVAYNYSANNYKMTADVYDPNTYTEEEKEIERFHDAYQLFYTDLSLVVKSKSWADLFKLQLNYSDVYKEAQNGVILGNTPYGEAFYESDNYNFNILYQKKLTDKLKLNNDFVYAHEKLFTHDTSVYVYSWEGKVVDIDPERKAGEIIDEPILSRRFTNSIVDRFSLQYQLSDHDLFSISLLYADQSIHGRDEMKPIEEDPLQDTQSLLKNISGIEYTRKLFNERLKLQLAGKHYYYKLEGIDLLEKKVLEENDYYGYYGTLKYQITDQFFVRSSYEKGVRIPNLYEVFGNGLNVVPNGNLEPEKSDNLNLGINYKKVISDAFSFAFDLSAFIRDQKDLIYLIPDRDISNYENQRGVEVKGTETELTINFLKKFRYSANLTKMQILISEINDGNISNNWEVGQPFQNRPTFFTNQNLEFREEGLINKEDKLRLFINYKFVDTFNYLREGKIRNDDNWVPTQHRVDIGISYTYNRFNYTANIYNLLDGELYDLYSVPRPGRNFNFRIAYNLNNY
ncbi:TonB-dependent receptor [Sediminitomix flava]|uniref:Outer membrane receptor protein involved in Fe transport n=1 Tax=Sediminitomix flava TaxID=379075 RepID=A0A315ZDL0_SEDFL|nr:TonB-dependent receptor [Sediminitomix flava]PWJ43219.1 outer membrane receptor protein involved in Fe transport [Sediminitomix flava]